MTGLQKTLRAARTAQQRTWSSVNVTLQDIGNGMLEVSHNMLALLGLVLVAVVMFASGWSSLRHAVEEHTLAWLQARQEARAEPVVETLAAALSEPTAIERATATDPKELNKQQGAVAQWLARRYRVAPEPISRLVKEAWQVGARAGLDPTLILAIMAIESSFNPFAQSPVGAQGLMQVMTKIHDDKYIAFGGRHAAFDPVTNLRVGVQVLKECIARGGSLEAGLRFYVGAANLVDDGGYAGKVLAEQGQLRLVANGKAVPPTISLTPAPRPAPVRQIADVPVVPAATGVAPAAPATPALPELLALR
ncbi:MAG: lytic transglycosylase domain-containing protein [Burkholderiaceae bacterium]